MGANHNGNTGKINGALELLNEAAKEKKDEILKRVTNKYSEFRETMEATKDRADAALHAGQVQMKKTAKEVDRKVRKNPWTFIGAGAAAALIVGFICGRSSKKS